MCLPTAAPYAVIHSLMVERWRIAVGTTIGRCHSVEWSEPKWPLHLAFIKYNTPWRRLAMVLGSWGTCGVAIVTQALGIPLSLLRTAALEAKAEQKDSIGWAQGLHVRERMLPAAELVAKARQGAIPPRSGCNSQATRPGAIMRAAGTLRLRGCRCLTWSGRSKGCRGWRRTILDRGNHGVTIAAVANSRLFMAAGTTNTTCGSTTFVRPGSASRGATAVGSDNILLHVASAGRSLLAAAASLAAVCTVMCTGRCAVALGPRRVGRRRDAAACWLHMLVLAAPVDVGW